MKNISRRDAIKSILAGSALASTAPLIHAGNNVASINETQAKGKLKGNIHHSVSKWCFEIGRAHV